MSKNKLVNSWIIIITIITVILAAGFSIISELALSKLNIFFAFITLITIIFIGVFFDIIGVASAVVDDKFFHAMASRKIEIAKYSLFITRNAPKFSSFCSDVIGDIAGIVSGAAGTVIVLSLIAMYGLRNGALLTVLMSSTIAGLTVGGKALGKEIAINKSKEIILISAKVVRFFDKIFKFV
jgi:CBS domain containing-hemolysin-like protein